ncbi:Elongator subunit elp2 [Dimargaris verticillata]|uniref:Elongator complex protein 2 n=1 Tax=Dimargaris verticillata TaxID=2761393 RepID=A0A9W8E8S5_9FUNG|nr:Elongator subunit elp2 [Dimargaris verticillata]
MLTNCNTAFTNIGCNAVPQAAVWCPRPQESTETFPRGLVAFGANHYVALYDPKHAAHHGIQRLLKGHTGRVNSVCALVAGKFPSSQTAAVVSASADKTARIWKPTSDGSWACSAILTGHTYPIISLGVLSQCGSEASIVRHDWIATGSTDGTIRLYQRTISPDAFEDTVECVQTISVGTRHPLCLKMAYLPTSTIPLLAAGTTDSKIHLYAPQLSTSTGDSDNCASRPFTRLLTLSGHENWVRCLDFTAFPATGEHDCETLMLASGSQDKYIRLWQIGVHHPQIPDPATNGTPNTDGHSPPTDAQCEAAEPSTEQMLETLQASFQQQGLAPQNYPPSTHLSTKDQLLIIHTEPNAAEPARFTVKLDAVVLGHDDWVCSVQWQPPHVPMDTDATTSPYVQPQCFISASADRSMIIWRPDPTTGIWVSVARVGEMGGAALGFYDGTFSPDGQRIIAHSPTGAFHQWEMEAAPPAMDGVFCRPVVATGGHIKPAQDLCWDPRGRFLVSVSLDQTARLYAEWNRPADSKSGAHISTWHEVARPQIHGYDLQCLAFTRDYQYVSGADEKVLRVLDAPQTFVESLAALTNDTSLLADVAARPVSANLPPLGLSNKALFEGDLQAADAQADECLARQYTTVGKGLTETLRTAALTPPMEEYLMQNTLWPETGKVYGHGYEVFAVAASHDGQLVASGCRATSEKHAVIRLVDTTKWQEYPCPLKGHALTVTRIRFSPTDRWLLTVSRDRSWCLYVRTPQAETPYTLHQTLAKAHARIIWDASWAHNGHLFATASRDKTVKLWVSSTLATDPSALPFWNLLTTLAFSESVTAVDFAPALIQGRYCLAVGLESGLVCLAMSPTVAAPLAATPGFAAGPWDQVTKLVTQDCPQGFVSRLAWRPMRSSNVMTDICEAAEVWQLACASHDHSVRVISLHF